MYYTIRFNLQKGEGHFPTKSELKDLKSLDAYSDFLKKSMRFSFNNDNGMLPLVEWKLVDDGLSSLTFSEEGYETGPQPAVWLHLEDEVDIEDEEVWADALRSDYVLEIPGVNENEPFYFQDHSSNSQVESAEWLADEIGEHLSELALELNDEASVTLSDELVITRTSSVIEDGIAVKLTLEHKGSEFIYTWYFENEDAMAGFEYYNNEYMDSKECESIEANPSVYAIHTIIKQNS
jgi:hypothetical protein